MILAAAGLTNAEDVDEFSINVAVFYLSVAREIFAPRSAQFEHLAGVSRRLPPEVPGRWQFKEICPV